MPSSAVQQAAKIRYDQARRASFNTSSPRAQLGGKNAPADPSAALSLAKSLATGQRNKSASLDRQLAGEAGARLGQAAGVYFGVLGAPFGKRLGRVLGEHWRLVLLALFVQFVLPFFLLAIGIFIIIMTLQSFFS